ncbi:hypothetical protein P2L56_06815 [Mannheimia haemolytica]|nr:hypothetical protein [Mannheimia haemolytica]
MLDNIKSGFRNSLITLLEIAQVRGEMARIEINEQKKSINFSTYIYLIGFCIFISFFCEFIIWFR